MCGRFAVISPVSELMDVFDLVGPEVLFSPRYNAAPTQDLPVVISRPGRQLALMRWGLIPGWAKDAGIGNKLINARAETLHQKPSFKKAFQSRRCGVPADGFYEWQKTGRSKVPHFIRLKSRKPFLFAGLWEEWQPPTGEPIRSFSLVTCPPNDLIQPVHNRMPVILGADTLDSWLDPDADLADAAGALVPYPGEDMEMFEVSTRVNTPANDDPELIQPVQSTMF